MNSFLKEIIIKILLMKMKVFNEIRLNIQLPSNSTYISMFTLSSFHLFLPNDYTFNAPREKYH
jgi:hypothetical protein